MSKLRKIIDNPSDPDNKKLVSDDKCLDSVRRRLAGEASKSQPRYNRGFDSSWRTSSSLEPRVVVHTKEAPYAPVVIPRDVEVVQPIVHEKPSLTEDDFFSSEDLYEIEKVDVLIPEFLEVTPKEVTKIPPETNMMMKREQPAVFDQNLPEWEPVEDVPQKEQSVRHEEPIVDSIPEFERVDTHITLGEITEKTSECTSLPTEITPTQPSEKQLRKLAKKQERVAKKAEKQKEKEAKRQKKLELQKLKQDAQEKEQEAQRVAQEQQKTQLTVEEEHPKPEPVPEIASPPLTVALDAFHGIESIDEKTAQLLYQHGYFSIENLHDATVNDLVQIQGMKRKLAKKIKKDVEQKTIVEPEKEFVPLKEKISSKKIKEEPDDLTEWESYHVDERTEAPLKATVCTHKGYTLYKKTTRRIGGKKTTIHFFTKEKPKSGQPAPLPEGYRIAINKRTRVPYLKKKK
jgi:hypothetical protein